MVVLGLVLQALLYVDCRWTASQYIYIYSVFVSVFVKKVSCPNNAHSIRLLVKNKTPIFKIQPNLVNAHVSFRWPRTTLGLSREDSEEKNPHGLTSRSHNAKPYNKNTRQHPQRQKHKKHKRNTGDLTDTELINLKHKAKLR